jgi:hypothetical protein
LLVLILISNVTLTPGSTSQDSKLLQEEATQQTIPETILENQEVIPEEIPEIPEISVPEQN